MYSSGPTKHIPCLLNATHDLFIYLLGGGVRGREENCTSSSQFLLGDVPRVIQQHVTQYSGLEENLTSRQQVFRA